MPHALVVDDKYANLEFLCEVLDDLDITHDTAGSVRDAVAAAASQIYDVILMDIQLPLEPASAAVIDGGCRATRQIRERGEYATVPIIACSAGGQPAVGGSFQAAGMNEFVDKTEAHVLLPPLLADLGVIEVPAERSPDPPRMNRTPTKVEPKIDAAVAASESLPPKSATVSSAAVSGAVVSGSLVEAPVSPPDNASNDFSLESDARNPSMDEGSEIDGDVIPDAADPNTIPTDATSLRHRVTLHLDAALSRTRSLLNEVTLYGRDPKTIGRLEQLSQSLSGAVSLMRSPAKQPRDGETYEHWIINRVLGINHQCGRLERDEERSHFGQQSAALARIAEEIRRTIQLARSPAGAVRAIDEEDSHVFRGSGFKVATSQHPPLPAPHASIATINDADRCTGASHPDDELGSGRLILIVDDQPEGRQDLEEKVRAMNHRAFSCDSASSALRLLELQRFDLCLMDLDMPEMDGIELIRRIRNSPKSCNTPLIVVSGSSERYGAADAIEKGADDYVEKPAEPRLLAARIRSCLRHSDTRMNELSKFIPRHLLREVIHNDSLLDKPMPADVSVLVCDIRGFSSISKRIGPVETVRWISDVMDALSQRILKHGGTVVDHIGDEIIAMWGAPVASPTHAHDACQCALDIQKEVHILSDRWRNTIGGDMRIGVGINSGLAVVGNTGSQHRLKYGPLGDTVNVASRVEGATKYLHSPILMTESTASRIDTTLRGRPVCTVRVQNIDEPIRLFELVGKLTEEQIDRRDQYETALMDFENNRLDSALIGLSKLLAADHHDGPAKLLMLRVIQTQLGGPFDPVWTLPGK